MVAESESKAKGQDRRGISRLCFNMILQLVHRGRYWYWRLLLDNRKLKSACRSPFTTKVACHKNFNKFASTNRIYESMPIEIRSGDKQK